MSSRHAYTTTTTPATAPGKEGVEVPPGTSPPRYHDQNVVSTSDGAAMSRAVALPPPNLDEAFRSIHIVCDTIHHAATQVLMDIRQLEEAYRTNTNSTAPSKGANTNTPQRSSKTSGSPQHPPHHHHLHSSPTMPGIISLHDDDDSSSCSSSSLSDRMRRRRNTNRDVDADLMSPESHVGVTPNIRKGRSARRSTASTEVDI